LLREDERGVRLVITKARIGRLRDVAGRRQISAASA
jgi:hypothetical protein